MNVHRRIASEKERERETNAEQTASCKDFGRFDIKTRSEQVPAMNSIVLVSFFFYFFFIRFSPLHNAPASFSLLCFSCTNTPARRRRRRRSNKKITST